MIKSDGLGYVRRGFKDVDDEDQLHAASAWFHVHNDKTFESLYLQLVDDHGLGPMAAVDILETAYSATASEFGQ